MRATRSPIPLYHQVFVVLRQRIVDGTYPVGLKLAPEDELALEFGVSRATIRQAVDELVRLEMVSRQQGRGTFVMEAGDHAFGQVFSGTLADLGRETRRSRIRDVTVEHDEPIPARIARQLALDDGARGTIVRRVRTMDGAPFAYTVNFMPEAVGKLLSKRELRTTSLMELLERKGVTLASARQTIRAQLADIQVARSLGMAFGSPALFVERVLLDEKDEPVEFVQSWYRGDVYAYTVTFGAGDGTAELGDSLA